MATIPERLEDWTLEALQRLIDAGVSESDRHDYKTAIGKAPDMNKGLAKLCCAFANTRGGFVVVGVGQRSKEFIIEGVDRDPEIYGEFLKKVRVEPDIRIGMPRRIDLDERKSVYVFEIPESPAKPHMPAKADERVFYKRVGSSSERMSLMEVRAQMNDYQAMREQLTLIVMDQAA